MRYVIGSYTSAGGPGLAFADSDQITAISDGPENPSWVVVGDHGIVYAVSETASGSVSAWSRGENGTWKRLGEPQWSGGSGPCHASLIAEGRFLAVANYGSGTVVAVPLAPDGALRSINEPLQLSGSGPVVGRQDSSHAHQALSDPSGRWVLVCDLGGDQVVTAALDPDSGSLRQHRANVFPPGSGPRHATFVGGQLVVVGELDSHAYICDWNSEAGVLKINARVELSDPQSADDFPSAVVPRPDGPGVYIALRGSDTVVELDIETMHVLRRLDCGGKWPRSAVLDSLDPRFLWVANERSGGIARIDLTGDTESREVWACPGAADIAVYQ